ncbi:photosynthetic reaction center subunit H [Sphingomonas hengshuiensis]|uniref:Photosynthetic reaction center subunit H n=1 Tax=Sphingomonas hengshuiensis TaxID=1609977 RepID=A0A7U5BEZ6_9SPHN|nr:photosynthetic reaction center subunit H [Sphingomonas hengshuiensis]AJP74047.1 photosynthetic reaction center subunit H [Sphingomonas hengshuiensis]
MHPQLTQGIDVALLVFWAFVLFFIGLVFYLRREDRREGYPLEDAISGRLQAPGGPLSMASTKSFLLPFGHGTVTAPTQGREPVDIAARRTERSVGAPYAPTGNPLVDGIGPAAWAERAKRPDLDMEGHPRIVPLDTAPGFHVAQQDSDLTGWPIIAADGRIAGTVRTLWIDKADRLVRYLDVALSGATAQPADSTVVPIMAPAAGTEPLVATGPLLAPMMMARVDRRGHRVVIDAITAAQFADVPRLSAPDQITLYEEERVQAYFGGGYLYASADRQEPLL